MNAGSPQRESSRVRQARAKQASPVVELMNRNIDDRHDVPYLAGYSKDGSTLYVDRHLAQAAPVVDGLPFAEWEEALLVHELVEKEAIDRGLTYEKAHLEFATPAEHAVLRELRADPDEYEKELRPYIKAAEHERITKPPKDLDCAAYRGSDAESVKLLAHLKKCGVEDAK